MTCYSEDDLGPVDCTVDLVVEFIKFVGMMVDDKMTSGDSSVRRLRGPYLAQLELMRLLKERHDNRWSTVFGQLFDTIRCHKKVILFFHTVHTDHEKSRDGLKFKT